MRKVVDSNYLQDERLRDYLAKSKSNFAVLTDYVAMEACKDNTLKTVFRSMSILSDFPKQVIVLKGTRQICQLSGRSSGLTRRMISTDRTRNYSEFCDYLKLTESGHPGLRNQLLKAGQSATEHVDGMCDDVSDWLEGADEVAAIFSEQETRDIRKGGEYTPEIAQKLMRIVAALTCETMRAHTGGVRPPTRKELPNTFLYRNALGSTLLFLGWLKTGSQKETRPEKIRNDLIDIVIATYATYFDGILSSDQKLLRLLSEMEILLEIIKSNVGNQIDHKSGLNRFSQ